MKKAWIITNEFLHLQKFSELVRFLVEAAERVGVELECKTNAEVLARPEEGRTYLKEQFGELPEFIISWDKDVRLAKYLELLGFPVYNSAASIAACDDKAMTHLLLGSSGFPMPKTIIAPMTYENIGYTNYNFLNTVSSLLYPMVIKECFGSFGAQVYLVNNKEELLQMIQEIGPKPILFQEFISESAGRDIRLQVVGSEVVAAMERYSVNGDFRANISNGGKMKAYKPTEQEIYLAVECCKKLGLVFAGVDLLYGKNDEKLICEVNANAHFKNIYECTGVNTADKIMEWITKEVFV